MEDMKESILLSKRELLIAPPVGAGNLIKSQISHGSSVIQKAFLEL